MTSPNKIQCVAGGLLFVTIISNASELVLAESINPVVMTMQISFAVIFAYALLQRARWARWTVGILSGIGVLLTILLLLTSWNQISSLIITWPGILMFLLLLFHSWVTYTLLIDKKVSVLFSSGGGRILTE
jgi:hypothetical protein